MRQDKIAIKSHFTSEFAIFLLLYLTFKNGTRSKEKILTVIKGKSEMGIVNEVQNEREWPKELFRMHFENEKRKKRVTHENT